MKCSNCGFENPEKSKYCGKCGKALMKIKITNILILLFILIIGILSYLLLAVPTEDNMDADKRTPGTTTTIMPTTASTVPTTVIPTATVPPIPVLTTITVSPSTASVIVGKTENFYFSPKDQFGTFMATNVVWVSSDTNVGTIDRNGVFSAKASGRTKVSAVNGSVIGSASVSVIRDPAQPLTPQLSFVGSESYTVNSRTFLRYRLTIDNWNDFPPELFDVAPDLPPCGLNKNATRTWVNIYYSINNNYIYGFCALSSPQDLTSIWFALEQGSIPTSGVYVELEDRRINKKYRSNTVSVN